MAKEKFYTSERNVQIVLSLLKANGIRKIIASPGIQFKNKWRNWTFYFYCR